MVVNCQWHTFNIIVGWCTGSGVQGVVYRGWCIGYVFHVITQVMKTCCTDFISLYSH